MEHLNFFRGKSVFITGHTGFKGAWLCEILKKNGAYVTGYALDAIPGSLFEAINCKTGMQSYIGDIRDYNNLNKTISAASPEIVIHLAAQPLVLDSYDKPDYTYETNVLGTVNLLECIRQSKAIQSVVVVTTDKVYQNLEHSVGYTEDDKLGGYDPYSASKACSELVAASYYNSFLNPKNIALSTARAGNVIGGGDIAKNRIIPDCIRAAEIHKNIVIRNPAATRPYQHVLEPLSAYLLIAQRQYEDTFLAGSYNIGPPEVDCITTETLVNTFCEIWGNDQSWEVFDTASAHHEAGLLHLDCSKIQKKLGWQSLWSVEEAIDKVIEWEKSRVSGADLLEVTHKQIDEYFNSRLEPKQKI